MSERDEVTPEFFQDGPRLGHPWYEDAVLRDWLGATLPAAVLAELEADLERFAARAAGEIQALGDEAEAEPPHHVPYDPWGRRIDRIDVSPAWRALDRISAEEGLVAIGYERAHGAWSRIDQFARLYLFSPSAATYACPLAMSDGAARCLEVYGTTEREHELLGRLTTRDAERFWTSGQWMTERAGGSDVGGTATIARAAPDGTWRLHGTKWFTSATTSQMAMTLARIEGDAPGSRGLSLFAVELRDADGVLRGIRVNRLKDKLGTRALPTAELTLDGTPAHLVGERGHGVRRIATLFNITRIYNAIAAAAGMRRAAMLARDYARRRVAFGRPLIEHPLHVETLAAMEVECAAAFHVAFRAVELLGREETGEASGAERALLRLLTPAAKLYTGKQAVAVASEALEAFGGAGYIEDTGLPRLLRDAQVLAIWEGTTNVLSLDVLRALESAARDGDHPLAALAADVDRLLGAVHDPALAESCARVRDSTRGISDRARAMATGSRADAEAGARSLAFAIARTYAGALLLAQAGWEHARGASDRAAITARRWCAGELAPRALVDESHRAASARLAGVVRPAAAAERNATPAEHREPGAATTRDTRRARA